MTHKSPEKTYSSFPEAYVGCLADLLAHGRRVPSVTDPLSVASHFGLGDRPALELLGYRFEITESRPTLFYSPIRALNLPYAVGLFLWAAAGSDSVDWLSYYHERAADFSRDKERLCGAFGKRLFDYEGRINQVRIIRDRLAGDPASRRAIGLILTPEDNAHPDLDYPCAIGTQYFLRDGVLDAVVYMRAQQALTILPYDHFMFSGLQSLVAAMLGVRSGRYLHFSGTFHFYENERDEVRKLIAANVPQAVDFGPISRGVAPLAELGQLEAKLRLAALAQDAGSIDRLAQTRFPEGSFEEHVRIVLTAHAYSKVGGGALAFIQACELALPMRNFLEAQWDDR